MTNTAKIICAVCAAAVLLPIFGGPWVGKAGAFIHDAVASNPKNYIGEPKSLLTFCVGFAFFAAAMRRKRTEENLDAAMTSAGDAVMLELWEADDLASEEDIRRAA